MNSVFLQEQWYSIMVLPNHEKKVNLELQKRGVKSYLPLFTTVKQWSDRKKKVVLPLFTSYVFTCINLKEQYKILNIPGVTRFVSFDGQPAPVPEDYIYSLKLILANEIPFELSKDFTVNEKVRVKSGPMSGVTGTVVRSVNGTKLVLNTGSIGQSIHVQVDPRLLEVV